MKSIKLKGAMGKISVVGLLGNLSLNSLVSVSPNAQATERDSNIEVTSHLNTPCDIKVRKIKGSNVPVRFLFFLSTGGSLILYLLYVVILKKWAVISDFLL